MNRFVRILLALLLVAPASQAARAASAEKSDDTVVVTGSREQVRRQIQSFVQKVTRMDGDLIGRWGRSICPMVVGLSDEQAQFMQLRLIEVQDFVRRKKSDPEQSCDPNLFVIVTDEADAVVASWKERDPGMFRWKTRDGVSRSNGAGVVRTWHNAIMDSADGEPTITTSVSGTQGLSGLEVQQGGLLDSRIASSHTENITAVVVLVDTRAAGQVSLKQLSDYVALVSLSQIDLTAIVDGVDTILTLFAEPRPEHLPVELTAWDYAFLKGLYRTSYSPMHQRMDLTARMARDLAPRSPARAPAR